MSDKKKILLLRLMVIPSLVFFLCLFSAALTPKDTPSVDASVMKKWVEDNRKTDSYMVVMMLPFFVFSAEFYSGAERINIAV